MGLVASRGAWEPAPGTEPKTDRTLFISKAAAEASALKTYVIGDDMASQTGESPIAVYGAIAANTLIAVAKFVAAFFTGSSSMLSEAVHSVVDTGNQLLMLLGISRSDKAPDDRHPFGYGQEMYFWSLIVAILLFSIGGGLSVYEGITHLQHSEPIRQPLWNYAVLGIAFLAEGASWAIAVRELLKKRKKGESFFATFQNSKDPSVFVVVAEDTAALLGIVVAFVGVLLATTLSMPMADGIASIVIGCILIAVASLLVYESRALVMGESADYDLVRSVRQIAAADPCVGEVAKLLTMQLGPNDVLVNMELRFEPGLTAETLYQAVDRVESRVREAHPEIRSIFLEAEAFRGVSEPSHG